MEKLLWVVFFVSGLLLANLAADAAASASPPSSMNMQQQAQILPAGRKGRDVRDDLSGYHHQVVVDDRRKKTAAAAGEDDGGATEGRLIDNADYSGVAMHAPSPPKHKHPKKP